LVDAIRGVSGRRTSWVPPPTRRWPPTTPRPPVPASDEQAMQAFRPPVSGGGGGAPRRACAARAGGSQQARPAALARGGLRGPYRKRKNRHARRPGDAGHAPPITSARSFIIPASRPGDAGLDLTAAARPSGARGGSEVVGVPERRAVPTAPSGPRWPARGRVGPQPVYFGVAVTGWAAAAPPTDDGFVGAGEPEAAGAAPAGVFVPCTRATTNATASSLYWP
jgi:hypothetical protein